MTAKWDNSTCASQLWRVAKDAHQLQIRFGAICRHADPEIRRRMEKLDALDLDLEDFVKAANDLADELQNEADAEVEAADPNGGSHRQPGYRHGDAA